MNPRASNSLQSIFQPYVFVLKEGGEIKKNFLDYSLMMLLTQSLEHIGSPKEETDPVEDD